MLFTFIDTLQSRNIPLNLFGYKGIVMITPRTKNNSDILQGKPLGAIEPMGRFVWRWEAEYVGFDKEIITQAIKEVT